VMMAINKVKMLNVIKTATSLSLLSLGYLAIKQYGLMGMAVIYTVVTIAHIVAVKAAVLDGLGFSLRKFMVNVKFVTIYLFALLASVGLYVLAAASLKPLVFLAGEAVVVSSIFCLTVLKYRLVNIKKREFGVDSIISFNENEGDSENDSTGLPKDYSYTAVAEAGN
jgi:hypothetical protein